VAEREKTRNYKEINFLRMVDHPCIVKYYSAYEVKEELWVKIFTLFDFFFSFLKKQPCLSLIP